MSSMETTSWLNGVRRQNSFYRSCKTVQRAIQNAPIFLKIEEKMTKSLCSKVGSNLSSKIVVVRSTIVFFLLTRLTIWICKNDIEIYRQIIPCFTSFSTDKSTVVPTIIKHFFDAIQLPIKEHTKVSYQYHQDLYYVTIPLFSFLSSCCIQTFFLTIPMFFRTLRLKFVNLRTFCYFISSHLCLFPRLRLRQYVLIKKKKRV